MWDLQCVLFQCGIFRGTLQCGQIIVGLAREKSSRGISKSPQDTEPNDLPQLVRDKDSDYHC